MSEKISMLSEYNESNISIDIRSIKRAQWTIVISILMVSITFTIVMIFGGYYIYKEIIKLSNSFSQREASLEEIERKLKAGKTDFSVVFKTGGLGSKDVTLNLKFEPFGGGKKKSEKYKMVSCKLFETMLNDWNKMTRKPIINNIFVFYGTHGTGKTFSSGLMGKVLSNFGPTVVVSAEMNEFVKVASWAPVEEIISRIEKTLSSENATVIWNFNELDTYLIKNHAFDSKDITVFAENTHFVNTKDSRRILIFTMNNAIMFKHDYWGSKPTEGSSVKEDAETAAKTLGIRLEEFTREGQLSRLYSFMGNNKFEFIELDKETAKRFAHDYIRENYPKVPEDVADAKISELPSHISTRKLVMLIDNSLNKYYET